MNNFQYVFRGRAFMEEDIRLIKELIGMINFIPINPLIGIN